jgi:flagellar hook-associated protein 2
VSGVDYRSLAELGIETLQTGQLTFDETAFDTAYDADPDAVILYLTDASGPLNSVVDSIDTLYVDTDDGILSSRDTTLEGIIEDIEERVLRAETRIATMSDILRSRFTAMESTLSRIQSTGNMINALFFSNSNQG